MNKLIENMNNRKKEIYKFMENNYLTIKSRELNGKILWEISSNNPNKRCFSIFTNWEKSSVEVFEGYDYDKKQVLDDIWTYNHQSKSFPLVSVRWFFPIASWKPYSTEASPIPIPELVKFPDRVESLFLIDLLVIE